jgi:NSS family neurotransmitter:Na+ symporter
MSDRETWTTRLGFILASVGSAVGLGNIWRFPFQTATNGGAAFLFVYLVAVLVIGLPAILAEFVVGRRAELSAIGAFDELGHPGWRAVGALGVFTGLWTLSYYSVVGGWVIRYVGESVTGSYGTTPQAFFGSVSVGPTAVALHGLFMLLTVSIVAFGIEEGIERATTVMVPAVVLILLGLAAYGATLPAAGAAYDYFLTPDFGTIVANAPSVIPAAVGQALFSLSLGFAVMITYASYIGDDDSLPVDGVSIAATNTFIGVLAGLVVFPLLFAQGVAPDTSGPGAVFVAIPTALSEFGAAGGPLGVAFFLVVLIAALSSAISLLEVVVSYLVDTHGFERKRTTVALGALLFVLGLPSAWADGWLGWFDGVAVNLLLPVAVLLVVFFVGWVLAEDAVDEFRRGAGDSLGGLAGAWLWSLRTVVLVAVLGTVALSLMALTGAPI